MEDESGIDLWPASFITPGYLCANLFPPYDATLCNSVKIQIYWNYKQLLCTLRTFTSNAFRL